MPDVFGMIMRAAIKGDDTVHLIERDDGYTHEALGSQYVAEFVDWPEGQRQASVEVHGRILDIGCGAGRVGLHFQNMGHEVVGIDISQDAVEASRKRGLKTVHLVSAESLDFPGEAFDTVVLLGNNFGILGNEDRIVSMLKDIHTITAPDGVVLAESRDVAATDNPAHLEYHERNRAKGRPIGLVTLRLKYQDVVDDWFDLRMASPEEMSAIAERAGWKLEKTYGPPELYVGVLRKV
ncbi:MAG: class I SAM-dependent methyltransferase [Candidatus Thorarchaeota archaeon]|jgi:SAM-dependent methyltransferase